MPAWSQPGTHNTLQPCIRLLMDFNILNIIFPKSNSSLHVFDHTWYNMAVMTFVSHYHRTRASSMATVRAWPRCSVPVTLGGGIHMEKVWSTAWGKASCTTTWHHEVWTFKTDDKQTKDYGSSSNSGDCLALGNYFLFISKASFEWSHTLIRNLQ